MEDTGKILEVAKRVGLEAGVLLGRMFFMDPANLRTEFKADDGDTPVTVIDTAVGELANRLILELCPDHGIWNEELGHTGKDSPWTWYVDPLDGTSNVAPQFRTSVVGLTVVYRGEPVIAVVADPFEHTLTFAERGTGAYVGALAPEAEARRIRVVTGRPRKARFAEVDGGLFSANTVPKVTFIKGLTEHVQNVRMFGSNILAASHVAQGRVEVWMMDAVGGHWDTAPGIVLITEAGGKVTDINGKTPQANEYHVVLGTNGELHDELLAILRHCYRDYGGFR